jgi:hypothetical protein
MTIGREGVMEIRFEGGNVRKGEGRKVKNC